MAEEKKQGGVSRRAFLMGAIRKARFEEEKTTVPERPKSSESVLQKGNEAFAADDFLQASEQYDVHCKANPEDTAVRARLGYALYRLGRFLHAKIEFERVLRKQPDNGFAALCLGLVLCRMGKADKAQAMWERMAGSGETELHQRMAVFSTTPAEQEDAMIQEVADLVQGHVPEVVV